MKIFLLIFLIIIQIDIIYAAGNNIINHYSVARFDSIPAEFVQKSAIIKHLFRHASVGTTIDGGLNCLQGTKSKCNKYPQYKYDRRNWIFQIRGNSGWYGKIDDFVGQVEQNISSFDVFSFKYCYLDGLDEIDEPCGKFPSKPDKVKKAWDYLKNNMSMLENKYPQKTFVWWTIPLTQIGQNCTDELNILIRDYCVANDKYLFDIADIECHDTLGNKVENSMGYEYAFKPYCGEQKPDAAACHPNDFGGLIIAKAFWVLMAKISGWDSDSISSLDEKTTNSYSNNIFPNPASDYIEITVGTRHAFSLQNVEIYNVFGEDVISTPFNSPASGGQLRVNVSKLPAGLYFVKVGDKVLKFVKI